MATSSAPSPLPNAPNGLARPFSRPNEPTKPRVLLGESLVMQGLITRDQLGIALVEQQRTGEQLGEALLTLGFATADAMRSALAVKLGKEAISLKGIVGDPSALAWIPKPLAKRHVLFPVSLNQQTQELVIATANPDDVLVADQINALLIGGPRPEWRIASSVEVLTAIEHFYGHELSIDGILGELESGTIDMVSLVQDADDSYSHPVIRLIDALLSDATLQGASDIHFEPEMQFLRIRYRVDGVLRQVRALHMRFWSAMAVRLKVMSHMNIAETRAPQDGRISLTISGRSVDFRSAVQPTIHGENFVLRILDRKGGIAPITGLGLSEQQFILLQLMLSRPEGILLVTGPTGSGKTTTLYSILGHLNREGVNIMTLEDPVEYPMPVIRQTSLSDSVKMDFAEGITSMMRQDPDIILVGEVRDKETADMAFRAAMTGHQVFSTLHTNSAIRSIPRLIDLGIPTDVLAGNVIGIIAQRLVRTLCIVCKKIGEPSPVESRMLNIAAGEAALIYTAVGCPACANQGYKGRMSIMELLKFDDELDELVTQRASLKTMNEHLRKRGFVSMAEDGMRKVRDGLTTVEEVGRVVDLTDFIR